MPKPGPRTTTRYSEQFEATASRQNGYAFYAIFIVRRYLLYEFHFAV